MCVCFSCDSIIRSSMKFDAGNAALIVHRFTPNDGQSKKLFYENVCFIIVLFPSLSFYQMKG
jgi:hypothetical protein